MDEQKPLSFKIGKNKSTLVWVGIAIIVVLLLGGGFWYWQSRKAAQTPATGLGGQLYDGSTVNSKLPETNPFKANSNPFTGTETNPLKKVIVNPF